MINPCSSTSMKKDFVIIGVSILRGFSFITFLFRIKLVKIAKIFYYLFNDNILNSNIDVINKYTLILP